MGRCRVHSSAEQIADACVHGIGLLAGLAGAIVLLGLSHDNPQRLAATAVYAGGLLAMLAASAAYNLGYHTRFRTLFRRFDHSAIFLMIGGTYTPFTTGYFGGATAVLVTGLIWSLSLGGIAMKLARPLLFERFSVALYLALGWIALLVIGPLLLAMSGLTAAAIVAGGVLYTGGITFHLWENLPFQNAIWHVFVLGAAGCHYLAVLNGVVLATV